MPEAIRTRLEPWDWLGGRPESLEVAAVIRDMYCPHHGWR